MTNTRLAADAREVARFATLSHLDFKGAKVFMSLARHIGGRLSFGVRLSSPVALVPVEPFCTTLSGTTVHGLPDAGQATFGNASLLLTGRTAIGCSLVRRICSLS